MKVKKLKKEDYCHTYVLAGSISDLSKIDFSFVGLKIINLSNEEEMLKYLSEFATDDWAEHNMETIKEVTKDFWDKENLYFLTPISFKKIIQEEVYYECLRALGVLFPSDIQFVYEIGFQVFDNKYIFIGPIAFFGFHSSGFDDKYEHFLFFDDRWLPDINEFIILFIQRYSKISYLKIAISHYMSSFKERYIHSAFVSLCICLEAIADGGVELSYRIRRNISILCGDNEIHSEIIFSNVKQIYSLRSKIVHGANYDDSKLEQYLPYLKVLVSRMIIELILHNIPNLSELNVNLTKLGFGQNQLISDGYKPIQPNLNSYVDLITSRLD